jgi:hypothetical protein
MVGQGGLNMTTTTFTVTDADVGQVLGVPDGYLTDLTMTTPPPVYETPSFDEGRQVWTAGYFVLRGSNDVRDIVSISPQTNGGAFCQTQHNPPARSPPNGSMLINASIGYRGDLIVVAVPKASVWNLTLSDV